MGSDPFKAFLKTLQDAKKAVKNCPHGPVSNHQCLSCGQYGPCTRITDLGWICLRCQERKN